MIPVAEIITAVLTGSAIVIAQLGNTYIMLRNAREAREQRGAIVSKLSEQSRKMDIVHDVTRQVQLETNGMKTELIKEVREASFAKGVKSETDKNHP
jgi:uncharacterized protein (DUF3084 family)